MFRQNDTFEFMTTENYENELLSVTIRDGILYGIYKVEALDLDGAIAATEFRKKISGDRILPALADVSSLKSVSREAREYFAKEAGEDMKAIAVLIKNPVTRMMVNFFMKFNKPDYPIRFFTARHEAVAWLSQFVDTTQEEKCKLQT